MHAGSILRNAAFLLMAFFIMKMAVYVSENGNASDLFQKLGGGASASASSEESTENSDILSRIISFFSPGYVRYTDDPNSGTGVKTVSENAVDELDFSEDSQVADVTTVVVTGASTVADTTASTEEATGNEETATVPQLSGIDLSQYVTNSEFDNNTDYDIDAASILAEDFTLRTDAGAESPQVLIIHTHGSECFTPDEGDVYEESDTFRTEDCNYNIIHVGDLLAERLESYGISVIHDRNLYDYPSYNGCYSRSMDAIQNYLQTYPDLRVVIDLHRDATEDNYKTTAEIDGKTSAQVMLVVGSDFSGLEHPNWRQNLQFAVNLQATMNALYPGLSRKICISKYRYNEQATTGSLLAEIGYTGNTLSEAETAAEYFGDSLAALLLRT